MIKGLGQSGGKGAMLAGAVAAAVLALGVWIGGQRDGAEDAPDGAVAVLPGADATSDGASQNATLEPNAVTGVSVGPEGSAATEPEPQRSAAATPQETDPEAPAAAPPQDPTAPAFDEVRRDPDGMTVIAGRAAPGSSVVVLNDGKEIAIATADGAGKFATLAIIPPDGAGHVLTLSMQDGTQQITSQEEILLAPIAAPVAVAQAESPTAALPEDANTAAEQDVAAVATNEDAQLTAALEGDDSADAPLPSSEGAAPETEAAEQTADQTPQRDPAAAGVPDATPLAGTATAEAETATLATGPDAAPTASEGDQAQSDAEEAQSTEVAEARRETSTPPETAEAASGDQPREGEGNTARTETAATGQQDPAPAAQPETVEVDIARPTAPPVTDLAAGTTAMPEAENETADGSGTALPETDRETAALEEGATPKAEGQLADDRTSAASNTENQSAEADTTAQPAASAPPVLPEPAAPTAPVAVLKSTADGVERIDTTAPQLMTNVALDTIGYSDQGDVQLAGRAQPDTREVRVYLNNNAVISLPVDQEGRWRGDLPNVDEGIYTLRVDELSAGGDVTSRVETPFKRESPETLAAASAGLTGPLSAVTVQKGDTLWAISRARYGDPLLYVKVFEANSADIRDPDLIYPGQVFDLPDQATSD